MQAMVNRKAIEGYGSGAVQSEVDYASPHRIIQMLLDGALGKIATAKGCMQRGESAEKHRQITWGMNIIHGLRSSLDAQQGGDIAVNLDALYEYMGRRLLEASQSNSIEILDEVALLLADIKAGWDSIPSEFH